MAGRHGRAAVLAVRSRACSRRLAEPRAEEWLLIEWPAGENAPTKYWLSTLPEDMSFRRLVDFAELRWRIERDYQELKQEGSAILKGEDGAASTTTPRSDERETIDLVAPGRSRHLCYPTVTDSEVSAPTSRTTHSKLDRNSASPTDRRSRQQITAMSMLRSSNRKTDAPANFVMQ